MATAQEKAVEYGLPATIEDPDNPDTEIVIDVDEDKRLVVVTIHQGGWAPMFVALDSLEAARVANAIHAARRLLAGTSFDMHRRESDHGGTGTD